MIARTNIPQSRTLVRCTAAFGKKVYTIKRANQTIGMTDSNERRFILGFDNPVAARKTMYDIDPEPKLRMLRSNTLNVSEEVNHNLNHIGVHPDYMVCDLTLDSDAVLFIPKATLPEHISDQMATHALTDGGFHLEEIETEDFLSYPFSHMIGIIIPNKLIEESNLAFVYSAMVVDASFNVGMYKANLLRSSQS